MYAAQYCWMYAAQYCWMYAAQYTRLIGNKMSRGTISSCFHGGDCLELTLTPAEWRQLVFPKQWYKTARYHSPDYYITNIGHFLNRDWEAVFIFVQCQWSGGAFLVRPFFMTVRRKH
jgi:hypothetical protein